MHFRSSAYLSSACLTSSAGSSVPGTELCIQLCNKHVHRVLYLVHQSPPQEIFKNPSPIKVSQHSASGLQSPKGTNRGRCAVANMTETPRGAGQGLQGTFCSSAHHPVQLAVSLLLLCSSLLGDRALQPSKVHGVPQASSPVLHQPAHN